MPVTVVNKNITVTCSNMRMRVIVVLVATGIGLLRVCQIRKFTNLDPSAPQYND